MDYDDYLDEQLFGDEEENIDQENDFAAVSTETKEGGEDETLKNVWESSKDDAKKKASRVTKSRPKLTEREIISSKGLPALLALFDSYKPSDKSTPYENVNEILNKLEYWAHGLFPQLKFEDFLEKAEQIGRKRLVQVSMQKLRYGISLDNELSAGDDNVKDNGDEPAAKTTEELFDEQFIDDFYDADAFSIKALTAAPKDTKNASQKTANRPDSEPEMDDDEFEEQLQNIFGKRDVGEKKPSANDDKHVAPVGSLVQATIRETERPWEDIHASDISSEDQPTSSKRRKTILDLDSGDEPPSPDRSHYQRRVTMDSDEEDNDDALDDFPITNGDGNDVMDAPQKAHLNAALWSDDEED